ncbi:hypothetical protein B0H10DRAFT_1945365 [Mycena sp. CBHHK59/15]|nr:hypothetical protein B0H10DRAFT_1945365 [Mycena sp. CBHHK59/15]
MIDISNLDGPRTIKFLGPPATHPRSFDSVDDFIATSQPLQDGKDWHLMEVSAEPCPDSDFWPSSWLRSDLENKVDAATVEADNPSHSLGSAMLSDVSINTEPKLQKLILHLRKVSNPVIGFRPSKLGSSHSTCIPSKNFPIHSCPAKPTLGLRVKVPLPLCIPENNSARMQQHPRSFKRSDLLKQSRTDCAAGTTDYFKLRTVI